MPRSTRTDAPTPRPTRKVVRRPAPLPQTRRGSRTEEAMERRLETLEPGSPRHRVLDTAIQFKRSWLALAQQLCDVESKSLYKEWGYRTFWAYAQHELHLRKETAQKLLRSYSFLESHERRVLETSETGTGDVVPLPSYQALDVLAEARENPYLSEQDYREVRDQVFGEDPSPAQVRKLVRERAPEPVKKAQIDPTARLRKCLGLAERLYGLLLEEEDVPEEIPRAVEEVVGGLRRVLGE